MGHRRTGLKNDVHCNCNEEIECWNTSHQVIYLFVWDSLQKRTTTLQPPVTLNTGGCTRVGTQVLMLLCVMREKNFLRMSKEMRLY